MAGLAHVEGTVEMWAGGTHSEGWKETQDIDLVRLDPFAIGEPLLKRPPVRPIHAYVDLSQAPIEVELIPHIFQTDRIA